METRRVGDKESGRFGVWETGRKGEVFDQYVD